MPIRCLIVEDEFPAQLVLENYIAQIPDLYLIAKCDNAMQALSILNSEPIDLLFLDINLPGLGGLDLIRTLQYKPIVILTTAYSDYALEGYQLDVLDYLLKPIAFERFVQAVNKAGKALASRPHQTVTTHHETMEKNFIFVKSDHKFVKVRFDDILYIEGLREYVSIYTSGGRYVILESMKNLEQSLPSKQFLRVHKSYIVAVEKVNAISGNELEINKINIPIGKSYRDKVMDIFEIE